MIALAFLNPMLLWALPLAAVPIVIHILNRRRFRTVQWAAMEYLLRAMKRNRKRLRMEQWLVLLLRTLAVLLLALLVSRPQLGGGGLFGVRTHHVVIVDDSASMQQQSGSSPLFVRARERVRSLAEDLAQRRAGDTFTVLRTSRVNQPDLLAQRVGGDFARRVGTMVAEWSCSDLSADLGATLQSAMQKARAAEEGGRIEYYFVGDQRSRDWIGNDDKPRATLATALAEMDPQRERLTAISVGGAPANVGIVEIKLLDRLLVADVAARFVAELRNHGIDPEPAGALAVEVDGRSRVLIATPALAPGEKVAVPFLHTFAEAGPHHVECALETADGYAVDDRRTLAVTVKLRSRVLLVDGEPDAEIGETFFLQAAFEPGGEAATGIETVTVTDAGLAVADLSGIDSIWLCNVQTLDEATAAKLEAFVAAGGGLIVACGPLVDASRYRELLWKDGKGLLPLPIGEVDGDPDRPERAVLMQREHPICEGVADVLELLVGKVWLVRRWLKLEEPTGHRATVVARIGGAEGAPLLATRTYVDADGKAGGEVALLAVSADDSWSNLPATHLFVVLANQVHRYAARAADFGSLNFVGDGTLRQVVDPGRYRADVAVRALAGEGDERTFTAVVAADPGRPQVEAAPVLTVPMAELRQRGAYAVELARHDGGTDAVRIARNATADESRLQAFSAAAFARSFPAELHERVAFVTDGGAGMRDGGEGEVWRWLAAALVAGLLLESLLAWRFGRH